MAIGSPLSSRRVISIKVSVAGGAVRSRSSLSAAARSSNLAAVARPAMVSRSASMARAVSAAFQNPRPRVL